MMGLILGLPLAVALMVLVKMLYIEDVLHVDAVVSGENQALKARQQVRK